MLRFTFILVFTLAVAAPCAAQTAPVIAPSEQPDLGESRHWVHTGEALTGIGLAHLVAGTAIWFGTGAYDWGIGEGVVWGTGGLLALIGIPMWIFGAVDLGSRSASACVVRVHVSRGGAGFVMEF